MNPLELAACRGNTEILKFLMTDCRLRGKQDLKLDHLN